MQQIIQDVLHIVGNLSITGSAASNITNLNGLSQLIEIEGSLSISGISLNNLNGLHNIKTADRILIQNTDILSLQGLDALEVVNKSVQLNNLKVNSLEGLGNLKSIGEDLIISNCKELTSVSGLTKLEEIGKSFLLSYCTKLTTLSDIPNVNIGIDLVISYCDSLTTLEGLNQITDDIQSLNIDHNASLETLAGLENILVRKDASILSNDNLLNLEGINLKDTLEGNLSIINNDKLTDFRGLEGVLYIEDLDVESNAILTGFEGLNSVRVIEEMTIKNNLLLKNFSALDSLIKIGSINIENNDELESISSFENIDTIQYLWIRRNDKLKIIDGFSSVKSIEDGIIMTGNDSLQFIQGFSDVTFTKFIYINSNQSLKNLNAFSNIIELDGPITIIGNNSLTDISGLSNIDPLTVNEAASPISNIDISITSNSMLEQCNIATICQKYFLSNATIKIENNAEGCQSVEEVIQLCDIISGIEGHLYEDINANDTFDLGDKPIAAGKVAILLENNVEAIDYTNNEGFYRILINPGDYSLTYGSDSRCHLPSEVDTTVKILDSLVTMTDYPLVRVDESPPLADEGYRIYLSRAATRCGFTVRHHVAIVNGTCLDSYASFNHKIDDKIDSVFNISIPGINIDQGKISYSIPEILTPGARFEFTFDAIMPGVEAIDSLIIDSIMVDYNFPGVFDFNGSMSEVFTSPITCAYDPNDKLAHPNRNNIYDDSYIIDEELTYTIRFQNTGNDTAFTVRLEDVISPILDLSTLRPVQASHDYQHTINLDNRLLTVTFDNILLPDSTTNLLGSNGYFTFSIMPKANLEEYTTIENFADIFFDFNPPIRTNTMELVYVSDLSILTSTTELNTHQYTVYPNPSYGHINIAGLNNFQYDVYNLNGRLMISGSSSGTINLLDLVASVYFLVLKDNNGIVYGREKIVKR
ncbi:MAG: hypothetical protein ACI94Y_000805 [Maribacter sp.]